MGSSTPISPSTTAPQKPAEVPAWIIAMFIFALVFCLFAVYKAFIHQGSYNFSRLSNAEESQLLDLDTQELITDEESASVENTLENSAIPSDDNTSSATTTLSPAENTTELNLENTQNSENLTFDRAEDQQLIQKFYQYLVNNELEQMNALVHTPLQKTKTRGDHWNAKNLKIFSSNLVWELALDNLFYIANSANPSKKTRQYSYTLNYTIQPDHHFKEDWRVTLLTLADGATVISEIMCDTKGCSRSPFFWPQNLGLK